MSEKRAVFALVDFDNIRLSVTVVDEEDLGSWLMAHFRQIGEIAFALLLVDFTTVKKGVADALHEAGFMLVHCPKSIVRTKEGPQEKDTVDIVGVECIHRILSFSPGITTIALASGDRDFGPVLATWKARGKEIVVLGHAGVSRALREIATTVIDIRPTVEKTLEGFRRLLRESRSPEDFQVVSDPSLVLVRNAIAAYIRTTLVPYISTKRQHRLTRTYLQRGLKRAPYIASWENQGLYMLIGALLETIFITNFDELGDRYIELDPNHPFVQFACSAQTRESEQGATLTVSPALKR